MIEQEEVIKGGQKRPFLGPTLSTPLKTQVKNQNMIFQYVGLLSSVSPPPQVLAFMGWGGETTLDFDQLIRFGQALAWFLSYPASG